MSEPGNDLVVPGNGKLQLPPGTPAIVDQLIAGWLIGCRSPQTRKAYLDDIKIWLTFLVRLDTHPLHATTEHVEAYMRVAEQAVVDRTEQPPRPTTIARRVAVVSSFYRYCKRKKVVTENPAEDAVRPPVDYDHSETVGMTEDEAVRLIAAAMARADDPSVKRRVRVAAERDAAMIALMLCTGGRVSEVISARRSDLGYDRNKRVLYVTRKGGKRQAIALGEAALVIDRHIANHASTTGLIFETNRGTPVDRSHVFRVIRKAAATAHIPSASRLSPHSMRHTFATLAFDAGADISSVQDAMGHADPRTTRRYDRARNRIDKSPVHAISRKLLMGE